jgi:hypothetical protein
MKYGMAIVQTVRRGRLAEMQVMSREVHQALDALATPAGEAAARGAGVTRQNVAEVRAALRTLDAEIARLSGGAPPGTIRP